MSIEAKHSPAIIPLTALKMLERLAYYGMRSILIVYILHTDLGFTNGELVYIYGAFTGISAVFTMLGGLLGDLVLGTRVTSIIGLSIQTAGYFLLAVPDRYALYSGLFLIALGTGLVNPNLLSMVNFSYQPKKKLMDAAFLIFYTGSTAGTFFVYLFSLIFSGKTYWIGFTLSGIFSMLSLVVLILTKPVMPEIPARPAIYLPKQIFPGAPAWRIISVVFILVMLPLFWQFAGIADSQLYTIKNEYFLILGANTLYMINPVIVVLFGIIFSIVWSHVYFHTFIKIVTGFAVFSIGSFVLAAIISPEVNNSLIAFVFVALALQAIAEVFISAPVTSYICQNTSVRFNAILIAVYLCGSTLVNSLLAFLAVYAEQISSGLLFTIIGVTALIIGGLLFLFSFLAKKDAVAA